MGELKYRDQAFIFTIKSAHTGYQDQAFKIKETPHKCLQCSWDYIDPSEFIASNIKGLSHQVARI